MLQLDLNILIVRSHYANKIYDGAKYMDYTAEITIFVNKESNFYFRIYLRYFTFMNYFV